MIVKECYKCFLNKLPALKSLEGFSQIVVIDGHFPEDLAITACILYF